jgi:hypothetical protein
MHSSIFIIQYIICQQKGAFVLVSRVANCVLHAELECIQAILGIQQNIHYVVLLLLLPDNILIPERPARLIISCAAKLACLAGRIPS